jgi:hypothetical protein
MHRYRAVGQDCLRLLRRSASRIEPRVEVLGQQIDDAAIVPGLGHRRRRFIRDGGKASQLGFPGIRPMGIQKHAPVYRGLHDHLNEVVIKCDDIGDGGLKLVRRDLDGCRKVLQGLGQDDPELDGE